MRKLLNFSMLLDQKYLLMLFGIFFCSKYIMELLNTAPAAYSTRASLRLLLQLMLLMYDWRSLLLRLKLGRPRLLAKGGWVDLPFVFLWACRSVVIIQTGARNRDASLLRIILDVRNSSFRWRMP